MDLHYANEMIGPISESTLKELCACEALKADSKVCPQDWEELIHVVHPVLPFLDLGASIVREARSRHLEPRCQRPLRKPRIHSQPTDDWADEAHWRTFPEQIDSRSPTGFAIFLRPTKHSNETTYSRILNTGRRCIKQSVSLEHRFSSWRFSHVAAMLAFGIMMLFANSEASAGTAADEAMGKLAEKCFSPLKEKGASKVAMTYLFHNGSKESPISNFVKRQLTTHLLRAAGRDIALIDRQDFQIRHQEDGFGFTFSSGDGELSQPEPVDVILVGELITSPAAKTMVIHLKAIDPKTSTILSAPVVSIELTKDLSDRLGISELDLSGLPPLPTPSVAPETWARDLSSAFDPQQVSCSLDDPGGTKAASALNTRLLRAYLTSTLVSSGWSLLEREMFFLVAKDQAAVGNDISGYPVGDVILRLQIDDTAPKDLPTCFAKAIQRKDGRLLGQAQIALSSSVAGDGSAKDIGGDQALAEAIRRTQGKLAPGKEDPLVFSASIVMTDVLKPSKELADRIAAANVWPELFFLRGHDIIGGHQSNLIHAARGENAQRGFEKKKIFEETLLRLNAIEKGNMQAIKADLWSFLLWGYGYDLRDEGGERKKFVHLGPLLDVAMQISATYSLSRDGTPTAREWLYFLGLGADWEGFPSDHFVDRLLQSRHPKLSSTFNRPGSARNTAPLKFPAGSHKVVQDFGRPTIHFDYRVEAVWKEAFPTTLKVTIDLTPMKKSIYKLRK